MNYFAYEYEDKMFSAALQIATEDVALNILNYLHNKPNVTICVLWEV